MTLYCSICGVLRSVQNAQIGVQQFVDYLGTPTNLTAVLQCGKQINQGWR